MKYITIAVIAWSGLASTPCAAQSQQSFPARPIRMIVPFSSGGVVDILARMVGQKMSDGWGQQVVVDNRPSAGGIVAGGIVAGAAPDGYTLLMNSTAHVVTPALYKKLPYDTIRDFTGVSMIASSPNVLLVAPSQGIKSVKELIALAKQRPGQINYGSAGVGSAMHINGEQFRLAADILVTHVPYKGSPDALVDTAAGRIQYLFSPIVPALPFIRDKRLVALAVSTASRSPVLPDVPTVAEAALTGFDFDPWFGLFAPAKTPRPVVNRLSKEVSRILDLPEIKETMLRQGAVPKPATPEQFDKFVRAELEKMGKVIRDAGLKVQ